MFDLLRKMRSPMKRNEPFSGMSHLAPMFRGGLPSFFEDEYPKIDMVEDENEIRIRAEIPGLDKDDLKLELTKDRLTLSFEQKSSREEKKEEYSFSEWSYGSFSRTIPLSTEVDSEKVEAKYKNGILTLVLPRSEAAKAKHIKVRVD